MSFFKEFLAGFREFGHLVNTLVTSTVLFVVFLFGIGPVALYAKLSGTSFLPMQHPETDGSYWQPKTSTNKTKEESRRPF